MVTSFDQARDNLWKGVWRLHQGCAFEGRDWLGRECSELLMKYVLPEAEAENLDRLRKEVDQKLATANIDTARVAAGEALTALRMSMEKVGQFMAYMRANRSLAANQDLWQKTLVQAPANEQTLSRTRIAAAEAAFKTALLSATDFASPTASWQRLRQSYLDERTRLTALAAPANPEGASVWRRDSPCPAPGAPRGGTHSISFAPSTALLKDFYPAAEQLLSVEGRAMVTLHIDETGCLQSAAIAQSTGSPVLDSAALAFATMSNYLPAEQDGKPVAATTRLPVNFSVQP
jgi:TonB family protein